MEKINIIGCGLMGSQIAAHLSNANIQVYAFDINQEIAEKLFISVRTVEAHKRNILEKTGFPIGMKIFLI